jgi:hypothetical protein
MFDNLGNYTSTFCMFVSGISGSGYQKTIFRFSIGLKKSVDFTHMLVNPRSKHKNTVKISGK